VQGLENVTLTQCDVSCPQSIEAWADQVQQLTQHCDCEWRLAASPTRIHLHGIANRVSMLFED
jgi:hypothetical protein